MNRQVQATRDERERKKHGSYNKYDTECAAIGKYACQYGPAAARYFSRKMGKRVSENTIESKKADMAESRKRPCDESVDHLPAKERGRKVLLGSEVDIKVQAYVRQDR